MDVEDGTLNNDGRVRSFMTKYENQAGNKPP